jgi:choice-of-anchor C domain-containing protein
MALLALACSDDKRSEFIDPAEPVELADGGMQVPEHGPSGVTGSGSGGGGCTRPGARTTVALNNGGFEQPRVSDDFLSLSAGADELEGWTISSGSLDLVGAYWSHYAGHGSLDLNGGAAATLVQEVKGKAGDNYELTFALAGNPDGAGAMSVRVSAGNASKTFTFDVTGHSRQSMGWKQETLAFTATAATIDVRFQSLVSGNSGPALDSVNLSHVACLD